LWSYIVAKKVAHRKKADGTPTKASVIRDVYKADKSLGPTAVAKAAAKKLGIEVTPTLVSQASSILKLIGTKKGNKRGRPKVGVDWAHVGNGRGVYDMAVEFAHNVGGIEKAGALIATLATIKAKL
jgi:hypothetical protein